MPARVQRGAELVELLERPDPRVDVAVVVDVVAAVGQRRGVEGAQPHGVDAELAQVVDLARDAAQVADAVAVRVGEAARVDLVDDRLPPPCRVLLGCAAAVSPRSDRTVTRTP